MLRHITLISLFILAAGVMALRADNPVVSVEGTYTYHGEPSDSPADCRRKAAQGARVEALRQFGTIVSQTVMQTESDSGTEATSRFLSLSESEVKGEWLGDEGEPTYDMGFDPDGAIYVTCRVRGRARAISNRAADFETKVLRNGTDLRHADTRFRDGDDMYVYFRAPGDGYVQIYLEDEGGNVFALLPYPRSATDRVRVRKGREYMFFDASTAGTEFGTVEELVLTAGRAQEYNKVYVLYSPNEYSMPPVHYAADGVPPSIDSESFASWLIRSRRNDPDMSVKSTVVVIDPSGRKTETIRQ